LAFALWTGRRLALVDKINVEAAKELVERFRVTALRLNPAAILMLASTDTEIDTSSLRYIYSGTAPLSTKTKDLFTQRYGIPILQGYGQSETGAIALSRYEDVVSGREPVGSVGRVLDDVTIRIAGSDDQAVAPCEEGEIQVRTNQAAEISEGTSLSITDDGYIRTGDVGKMDADRFLWVTGRLTDKMVVGGFNVFPVEVEDVLRRSDLVQDAVVVGVPDERLGERPVAAVVWAAAPDHDALARFAREKLAAYKVPRQWCDLETVPLTDRGKVDRREALSLVRSLVPES
jgi:acyl-CoA synthetase (AMP-forming)/AMP-acid ligase II